MKSKKVIKIQLYEEYWKLTLEYTDIYGEHFNNVLKAIVDFIDNFVNPSIGMTSEQYKKLQEIVFQLYPKKDYGSVRKSINQFYKLGFINNGGKSYHYLTKTFLEEKDRKIKEIIFSKILYENASFQRSYDNPSNINELDFLIKTLEECKTITKDELFALLYTDISRYNKNFLTKKEVQDKYQELVKNDAINRKYNQNSYLFGICKHLTGVYFTSNTISITPSVIENKLKDSKRDPYLQHLFKEELISEVNAIYNCKNGECILEHLSYPTLIASHIKPYSKCSNEEQFDRNNGLLLSKNMDSLFDKGYITFDDFGNILVSRKLDYKVCLYLKEFKIDSKVLNDSRRKYMDYHRQNVFLG